MKKLLLPLLLVATLLTSCSSETIITGTKDLEIPLKYDTYVVVPVPANLILTTTDNNYNFEFGDVKIYRASALPTGKTEDFVTYRSGSVGRRFNDLSIIIDCNKSDTKFYVNALNGAKILARDTKLPKDLELKSLPDYTEQEMGMTDAGLYMPANSSINSRNVYTADIYTDGIDFVESYVLKDNFDNLRMLLINIARCNSTDIVQWYKSDDIFYIETTKYVAGMKRLAENKWCLYVASQKLKDYALQGITAVHFTEEN